MKYLEMIKGNARRFTGDETVMWAAIEQVDELLEDIKEHDPHKYYAFMRKAHELMHGKHFDMAYAKWEVEQMHHTDGDGKVCKGEHWTVEQAAAVMSKHRADIPAEVTEYDVYVALNSHWHDYFSWAKKHYGSDEDRNAAIISMAIVFWFADEDWPTHTKVWDYFRLKNTK